MKKADKYPLDYAITQTNLGDAFLDLSEIRNKKENLEKALHSYEEALKISSSVKSLTYEPELISRINKIKNTLSRSS